MKVLVYDCVVPSDVVTMDESKAARIHRRHMLLRGADAEASLQDVAQRVLASFSKALHFGRGHSSPVDAFWSIRMFNTKRGLVGNPIQRYAIGTERGLAVPSRRLPRPLYTGRGSGGSRESNWLPAPAAPFLLTMRLYLPKLAILNGEYRIPPISCSDCSKSGSLP